MDIYGVLSENWQAISAIAAFLTAVVQLTRLVIRSRPRIETAQCKIQDIRRFSTRVTEIKYKVRLESRRLAATFFPRLPIASISGRWRKSLSIRMIGTKDVPLEPNIDFWTAPRKAGGEKIILDLKKMLDKTELEVFELCVRYEEFKEFPERARRKRSSMADQCLGI